MHGIYVDAQHCMRLIPHEPQGVDVWNVQGVDHHGTSKYDPEGWEALLTLSGDDKVVMLREDVAEHGTVKNEDTIVWDNGDVWSRLQLSYMQAYLLTRRPYVPLTMMLFFKWREALTWSWNRFKDMCKGA